MVDQRLEVLERVLVATWPPLETEQRGGWLLGWNGGFTGRANSLTVLDRSDRDDLDELVSWMEAWYRRRDAVPAARLTPLSADVEAALVDRGYRWWRNGATVMCGATSDLRGSDPPAGYRVETGVADHEWFALAGQGDAERRILDRMFDAHGPPARHVVVRDDAGEVAAIGRGVLAGDHVMISGMETATAHRRRGLARAVLTEIGRWASGAGASVATLQVEVGNDTAHALYESLGLRDVYSYSYLWAGGE